MLLYCFDCFVFWFGTSLLLNFFFSCIFHPCLVFLFFSLSHYSACFVLSFFLLHFFFSCSSCSPSYYFFFYFFSNCVLLQAVVHRLALNRVYFIIFFHVFSVKHHNQEWFSITGEVFCYLLVIDKVTLITSVAFHLCQCFCFFFFFFLRSRRIHCLPGLRENQCVACGVEGKMAGGMLSQTVVLGWAAWYMVLCCFIVLLALFSCGVCNMVELFV